MSGWDIEETRKHILHLYGRSQLDLVRPSLRSVVDRKGYARLHYLDARDTLDSFVQVKLQKTSLLEVFLADDDETQTEFQIFILKIGAYVTACIQSLHAVADILGHAIYYGLAMDRSSKPLLNRNISAGTVLRKLQDDPGLARLYVLYDRLCNGGSFSHLTPLANHSKHRSVVLPSLNEDQTGQKPGRHMLRLAAFEYEGENYPEVSIKDFLAAEYDRCSVLVIEIGNELNAVLRARIA